jgi:ubiquinone/menaquinone biosynthesis C-methylase UbiE
MEESALKYRFMVWEYRIRDVFGRPGNALTPFGIRSGDTVVDYGCGPGRHIRKASELVGAQGRVYAADVSETALGYVRRKILQFGLSNVVPVAVGRNGEGIPDRAADVVYALDMFHRVEDPEAFLAEIARIVKPDGIFYLEDGH